MKKKNQDLYNAANERAKYKYRTHLRRALKKDEKTIIATLKHIRDYEIFTGFEGFGSFNDTMADKYISSMFNSKISLSYMTDNIRVLKEFLRWLERQTGYKSKIHYNHIDYLNVSDNQRKTAKATEYKNPIAFPKF